MANLRPTRRRAMLAYSLFIGSYFVVTDHRERSRAEVLQLSRPVFLYDGDCAFCTSCAQLVEKRIRPEAEIVAWQFTDLTELGVSEEEAADAVQWVEPDGTVHSGHEAIAAMLSTSGPIWRTLGRILLLPGISWGAARAYQLVATNRHRLPGGTPACERSPVGR